RTVLLYQLDAHHQAQPSHVSDGWGARLELQEPAHQLGTAGHRVGEDVLLLDHVQGGDPGRTGDRVTAEGRSVGGGLPLVHQPAPSTGSTMKAATLRGGTRVSSISSMTSKTYFKVDSSPGPDGLR